MSTTLEKGLSAPRSVETSKLIVRQPAKLAELGKLLETFDNLNARVSERVGEDLSGDMGGAGAAAGARGDDGTYVSPRDQAIKHIPAPRVMKQKLERHILSEVRKLERLSKAEASSAKPGAAFRLNELYARIRHLNALLRTLVEASYEILKRLFIRVFIDKQSVM